MCGIAGMAGALDRSVLQAMTAALDHRGPDGSGTWCDPGGAVGLGHTRLAIIDPTPASNQPLSTADGRIWITFNGEIYNYVELAEFLSQKYPLRKESDTEVLLYSYLEWGHSCVDHLNGMFAFGLWDDRDRSLWLVRDRMGIKPLYYSIRGTDLRFGSEIRAITADLNWPHRLDLSAVDDLLRFRYVRQPRTLIEGIQALMPGEALLWQSGRVRTDRYWQLPESTDAMGFEDAESKFTKHLADAVRMQLRSDVPMGIFLSGGVDSSTILALASEHSSKLKAYCIGFDEGSDERPQAQAIANHFGVTLKSFQCRPGDIGMLPQVVASMDMPVADTVIVPTFMLSQVARQEVKTVLTGEGGDEILAGYAHQKQLDQLIRWRSVLGLPFIQAIARLTAGVLPIGAWDRLFSYGKKLGRAGVDRMLQLLQKVQSAEQCYLNYITLFSETERDTLYSGPLATLARRSPDWTGILENRGERLSDPLDALRRLEFTGWLPSNILMKQDALTMANGLEGRVPFLDHLVVHDAMSWRSPMLRRSGNGKRILTKYLEKKQTPRVASGKVPFMLQTDGSYWPHLQQLLTDHLLAPGAEVRRFLDVGSIQGMMSRVDEGPFLRGKQLTALLVLELWLKSHRWSF
jgi:asparagine synthase (glutamine-hydrolysing)